VSHDGEQNGRQYGGATLPADEQPTAELTPVRPSVDDRPTIPITAVTWPLEQGSGIRPGATRSGAGGPATAGGQATTGASAAAGRPTGPSAPDDAREGGSTRRRRTLLAGGVAVVVLLAAGAATAGYAYAGEVPRGTRVLGLDLGGKSRAEAARLLRSSLDRRDDLHAPVVVRIGEKTGEVSPTAVGLAVDVEATVAAAVDHRPSPLRLLFGSREVTPVVAVDPERLDAELRRIVGEVDRRMTMPAVRFDGTTPVPVYPKPGWDLRAEDSARAIRDGWLSGRPVVIPLVESQTGGLRPGHRDHRARRHHRRPTGDREESRPDRRRDRADRAARRREETPRGAGQPARPDRGHGEGREHVDPGRQTPDGRRPQRPAAGRRRAEPGPAGGAPAAGRP